MRGLYLAVAIAGPGLLAGRSCRGCTRLGGLVCTREECEEQLGKVHIYLKVLPIFAVFQSASGYGRKVGWGAHDYD